MPPVRLKRRLYPGSALTALFTVAPLRLMLVTSFFRCCSQWRRPCQLQHRAGIHGHVAAESATRSAVVQIHRARIDGCPA